MTNDVPDLEKVSAVSASFLQLKAAATELNSVSDELGDAISAIEATLKELNLGISGWVKVHSYEDEDGNGDYYARELGYAKVSSKWGIALRIRQGNEYADDRERIEAWLFNDAPRWFRVEAVDRLPELLDGLTKEAYKAAEEIRSKIGHAKQVVAGIKETAAPRVLPESERAHLGRVQRAALESAPKKRK